MSKRRRSGRIAPNPNTAPLKAQTAQRRRELAASAAVQRANQRAVRAARLAQGLAEAQQVVADRPDLTVDDYLMLSRQALDRAGELLGIPRPEPPTEAPAGAQVGDVEIQAPHGAVDAGQAIFFTALPTSPVLRVAQTC